MRKPGTGGPFAKPPVDRKVAEHVIAHPVFATSHSVQWDWAINSVGDHRELLDVQSQRAAVMFQVKQLGIVRHLLADEAQDRLQSRFYIVAVDAGANRSNQAFDLLDLRCKLQIVPIRRHRFKKFREPTKEAAARHDQVLTGFGGLIIEDSALEFPLNQLQIVGGFANLAFEISDMPLDMGIVAIKAIKLGADPPQRVPDLRNAWKRGLQMRIAEGALVRRFDVGVEQLDALQAGSLFADLAGIFGLVGEKARAARMS